MKWRNAAVLGNDGSLAAARGLTSHSNSQLSPTSTSILIAIAMVIVGYFLGKLIWTAFILLYTSVYPHRPQIFLACLLPS